MNPVARVRPRQARVCLSIGLALLFVVASLTPGLIPSADAQQPPVAEIQLVGQQIHADPGGTLGASVRVTNRSEAPLSGLTLQVGYLERVDNRTALHEIFDGSLDPSPSDVSNHRVPELEPDESVIIDLNPDLATYLPSTIEGVYPYSVTLYSTPDLTTELSSFTSAVILYPEDPEVPLNFVVVVPLIAPPARGPDGHFAPDDTGTWPLETAIAADGWIRGIVDAATEARAAGLKFAVAPSPRTLAEIADMANGYTKIENGEVVEVARDSDTSVAASATLDGLRAVLAQSGVQPLLSAYSNPDLPVLLRELDLDHVAEQLSVGETTLDRLLPDATFRSNWLFPTGARWDQQTLEEIRRTKYSAQDNFRTFVGAEFLDPKIDETTPTCPDPGFPEDAFSFTCPVSLETEYGPTQAYVRDPDLQARFTELSEPGGDALDLQRLFAESALIHLQYPGVPERVASAIVPAHWEPRPFVVRRLLNGLGRAPWLASQTPAQGFTRITRPRDWNLVERAPDLSQALDYETLPQVETKIETYAEIGPPEERIQRLESNLLAAMSRSWLGAPEAVLLGNSYITSSDAEIEDEFSKIEISGPDTTLTSQQSAIEVNVFNDADYPVTVDVDFRDQNGDIRIAEEDQDALDDLTVNPDEAPAIKVDAIADSSGIFNLDALILSPDSRATINSSRINIRSTNFNQIALTITFGALAFLILFYVVRLTRRRRRARTNEEQAPESQASESQAT